MAAEAGVAIVGGHSIDDPEPKYGLAVTGTVHPDRLVRNSTARAGDALFLTKPVGGGVASTALKRGSAPPELIARGGRGDDHAEPRRARRPRCAAGASAMTDVTGFGLLGHLRELAAASGVAAEVDAAAVPAIDGVLELLRGAEPPVAGGTRRNRDWVEEVVDWADAVPEDAPLAPLRRDDLRRPAGRAPPGARARRARGSAAWSRASPAGSRSAA